MNKNLKTLDKFDKNTNIYDLVLKLSVRSHVIMKEQTLSGRTEVVSVPQQVLDEVLAPGTN